MSHDILHTSRWSLRSATTLLFLKWGCAPVGWEHESSHTVSKIVGGKVEVRWMLMIVNSEVVKVPGGGAHTLEGLYVRFILSSRKIYLFVFETSPDADGGVRT